MKAKTSFLSHVTQLIWSMETLYYSASRETKRYVMSDKPPTSKLVQVRNIKTFNTSSIHIRTDSEKALGIYFESLSRRPLFLPPLYLEA